MLPVKGCAMSRPEPPLMIIRLHSQHHSRPEITDALLAEIARHPGCCDEVWMATGPGFLPIDEDRRLAELMAAAADKFRAAGIVPSLQIGVTLGHADMAMHSADAITWQRIVGPDGQAAQMCNCPRDPALHEYYRMQTEAYASWGPAWIWIDDDLRMHHHYPITWGCFCERCVAAFAAETGRPWDRPSLVEALNTPDGGEVRLAWTHFNGRALADLADTIARAAHAVAPDCRLGLQHCSHDRNLYDGPDFTPIFGAMAEATGHPVGSRPGCGCYDDHAPREMIRKGYAIAMQVARLPDCVDAVCPEVENFTHNAMGKSAHGTAVEATLDLALGCNCLSFAVICSGHETMEWYGRHMLSRLAEWRPFWQQFIEVNAGTRPAGLEIVLGPRQVARPLRPGEQPFDWATINLERVYQLSTMGVPLCFDSAHAPARLLHADAVDGLTEAELRAVLAGGVVLDGAAAMRVHERGLGELLCVEVEHLWPLDCWERLTDDPANGPYGGAEWRVYFARKGSPVFRLTPTGNARVLGELITRDGEVRGAATALTENAIGGRLAILGFDGFQHVLSSAKRAQWLAAADWACSGRLPVLIEQAEQVVAVPRVGTAGRVRTVTLLNARIDATGPLTLRVRNAAADTARWISPADDLALPADRDSTELKLELPKLDPWQIGYCHIG